METPKKIWERLPLPKDDTPHKEYVNEYLGRFVPMDKPCPDCEASCVEICLTHYKQRQEIKTSIAVPREGAAQGGHDVEQQAEELWAQLQEEESGKP